MAKKRPPLGRQFVRYEQLMELGINISREQLWRLERLNMFPRRIYLSRNIVVWDLQEVLDHIERLKAERATRIYRDHD